MPNYDYQCLKCNHRFEEFQKMTDELLTSCPICKGPLKRLIGTGMSPIFKGTGFYQTDYKNSPSKAPAKNEKTKSDSKIKSDKTPKE